MPWSEIWTLQQILYQLILCQAMTRLLLMVVHWRAQLSGTGDVSDIGKWPLNKKHFSLVIFMDLDRRQGLILGFKRGFKNLRSKETCNTFYKRLLIDEAFVKMSNERFCKLWYGIFAMKANPPDVDSTFHRWMNMVKQVLVAVVLPDNISPTSEAMSYVGSIKVVCLSGKILMLKTGSVWTEQYSIYSEQYLL